MKLGIDSYSTRNSGLDPVGVLELAAEFGLQGVLFELTPFESFRREDLARVRQRAETLGLYIELGMGSIFHWHPMAEKGRKLLAEAGYDTDVSEAQIVVHHLDVARQLGSPILRVVGGNLFTRDEGHDMIALADQAVGILREACGVAEKLGMKIAMENHADFTVRELMGILARVGSPAFGFTVDTGNLAFDLDDPQRLARIMAPHAVSTHFKNYRVVRSAAGLGLENCALGEGEIDVVSIAQCLARQNPELHLNIEIHSQFGPFPLNIFEETYFLRHPAPPGDGLAWYLKQAWRKEVQESPARSLGDGAEAWRVERPHIEQSIQWIRGRLKSLVSD